MDKDDKIHIADTVSMVDTQIELSLVDSNTSVEDLMHAIEQVSTNVERINATLNSVEGSESTKNILSCLSNVEEQVQSALVALQFYDKLEQRLSHVRQNLRLVSDLVQQPDQEHVALWNELNDKLRSVYTLEQERTILNAFASNDKDLLAVEMTEKKESPGKVELF